MPLEPGVSSEDDNGNSPPSGRGSRRAACCMLAAINLPDEDVPLPRAKRAEKEWGPAARLPLGAPQMPLNPNTLPPQPRRLLPPLPMQKPNVDTGAQPSQQPAHGVFLPTPDRPYPTAPPAHGSPADSRRGGA